MNWPSANSQSDLDREKGHYSLRVVLSLNLSHALSFWKSEWVVGLRTSAMLGKAPPLKLYPSPGFYLKSEAVPDDLEVHDVLGTNTVSPGSCGRS